MFTHTIELVGAC